MQSVIQAKCSKWKGEAVQIIRIFDNNEIGASVSGISWKASTSEFSSCVSLSQELEYDLYDCHIDNVMAAPGSMFAPAYWDSGNLLTADEPFQKHLIHWLYTGIYSLFSNIELHALLDYNAILINIIT